MGRSFAPVGLSAAIGFVSVLGFVAGGPSASAREPQIEPRIETASIVVRAWGKYGAVHTVRSSERQGSERALAREVNAGTISRSTLRDQLALGIGRFLQQVRTEPVLSQGHFRGWRLTSLFASRSDVHVNLLRAGDTVLRVNGQSIERPEAFKALWDSMTDAKELVLDIERDGKPSKLRYTIAP